jgi:hypothetical protein
MKLDLMLNREAIKFFAENAGYCTPPGRMACAKRLADAEAFAENIDLKVTWEADDSLTVEDLCGDFTTPEKLAEDLNSGRLECLHARVEDACGGVLASLGGILIRPDDRDYRRVVEAELKLEAIESLKRGGAQ